MGTDTAQGMLQKHWQHDPPKYEILPKVFRRTLGQQFIRCAKPTKRWNKELLLTSHKKGSEGIFYRLILKKLQLFNPRGSRNNTADKRILHLFQGHLNSRWKMEPKNKSKCLKICLKLAGLICTLFTTFLQAGRSCFQTWTTELKCKSFG